MLIVGLTGSIGMGKSAVLDMFAERGIPTFDADAAVHKLYEGKAAALIEDAFEGTVEKGVVNRAKLSKQVVGDANAMKKLEGIVHPLVAAERKAFLLAAAEEGAPMAVLDIPLLFEIGAESDVDAIVVASAPRAIQKERVLARPGMTQEKFRYIVSKQVPDKEKKKRADYIVDTGGDLRATKAAVDKLIESLKGREGTAFARLTG